jgi:hypothetical protein
LLSVEAQLDLISGQEKARNKGAYEAKTAPHFTSPLAASSAEPIGQALDQMYRCFHPRQFPERFSNIPHVLQSGCSARKAARAFSHLEP